jgi:hypothetical protein
LPHGSFPAMLLMKLYKESHPMFKLTEEIPFYEKIRAGYEKTSGLIITRR